MRIAQKLTLAPHGHDTVTIHLTVKVSKVGASVTITDGTNEAEFYGLDVAGALLEWSPILEWRGSVRKTLMPHFKVIDQIVFFNI